jgi:hypothetical protein
MNRFVWRRILACAMCSAVVLMGAVTAGWAAWSCWYWPYHNSYNPNLYDTNEAMHRYDAISRAQARNWEYYYHGPPQNPAPWWGHCHAWAAAAVWEPQPKYAKKVNGVTFRVRDRKGLLVETYHTCANGNAYELYADNPSPGLFWYYLRKELKGINPMHGKKMGFVGELHCGSEVWNYPIYNYSVNYSGSSVRSGTMKIWVAADSKPLYADSTTLYYQTFTYRFSGVRVDSYGNPLNSGSWIGSGYYYRPDSIWRPYYANTWTKYVENSQLSSTYLSAILK